MNSNGWCGVASDPMRSRLSTLYPFDGFFVNGDKPLIYFKNEAGPMNQAREPVYRSGALDFCPHWQSTVSIQIRAGNPTLSEVVIISGVHVPDLRLLDSTDDQVVLMVAAQKQSSELTSQLVALAATDLKRKFVADVNDTVQCMVRDKLTGRIYAGGVEGLWIWTPRNNDVQPLALPGRRRDRGCDEHASIGKSLAILCGTDTRFPQLYCLDHTKSPMHPSNFS